MAFIKKLNSKLFSFYYILKNFAMFKYDKKKIKVVESPMKLRYYFNVEIEGILVMMKCFFCKGEMVDDVTNYMSDIGGKFVIIKNVPCHKCTQCGEISYNGKTAAQLEKIVAQAKEKLESEVFITEYKTAA